MTKGETTNDTPLGRVGEYVAFPLRETCLALRLLSSDLEAGQLLGMRSQRLGELLTRALDGFNAQYTKEILQVPEQERSPGGQALRQKDMDNILASGLALNLPYIDDALLIVGQLFNPQDSSGKPFGLYAPEKQAFTKTRYWILSKELLKKSATTVDLCELSETPDNFATTDLMQGVCAIVLRKNEKLDKTLLRQCDLTFGLSKLIALDKPWMQHYQPCFQIYHEEIDAMLRVQKTLRPGESIPTKPQVEQAFSRHGATAADLFILPSPMEFVSAHLSLLTSELFRELQNEPTTVKELEPQAPSYLFTKTAREDLIDSFRRTAFFLSTEHLDPSTKALRQEVFLSKGLGVKVEKVPSDERVEPGSLFRPNDITEGILERLCYGHSGEATDEGKSSDVPTRPGHLLDIEQACALPKELLACLQDQLELRLNPPASAATPKAVKSLEGNLIKVQNDTLLKQCKGHLLWAKIRLTIEAHLLVNQIDYNRANRPLQTQTVAITQRMNQRGHLRALTGFSANMVKTPFDDAPFPWAEPFFHAPARSCFQLAFLPNSNKSVLMMRVSWLHMDELTFLVRRDDKKEHMEGAFPENGLYSPVAVYPDEEAAKQAIANLEEISGCEENLIAYGTRLAKKSSWLGFMEHPMSQVRAILSDVKMSQVESGGFRGDLFGVKI